MIEFHARIRTYIHTQTRIHTHPHTHTPSLFHAHTHTRTHTPPRAHTHTQTNVHTHTHSWVGENTGWRRPIGWFELQVIFCKRAPLIEGLFCGKFPINIWHPMGLRHPVAVLDGCPIQTHIHTSTTKQTHMNTHADIDNHMKGPTHGWCATGSCAYIVPDEFLECEVWQHGRPVFFLETSLTCTLPAFKALLIKCLGDKVSGCLSILLFRTPLVEVTP